MRKVLCVTLLLLAAVPARAAQKLTYADLVGRLTDMQQLAVLPAQGETCAQWSSWDRASKYDEQSGKYVHWDANGDNNGMIRDENGKHVMAEMQGPGVIWRIWSAAPKGGHVRIYLDGASEPAVDLPFSGYFDGNNEPFVYPSLVHDAASGKNCYVPIPYQKSCKVVADDDWGAYYQFVYTTFPKGTVVPTFTRDLSPADRSALDRADYYLTKALGTRPPGPRSGEARAESKVLVRPGKSSIIARTVGAGAITSIVLKPAAMYDELLRNVTLRIYWDGEKTPSLEAPIGDFFGTGPGVNYYKSLPMGMTQDGFYSYWYMPYSNGAVIEIENGGDTAFIADFVITEGKLAGDASNLGRFHAKWHRDALLPTEPERWIDWPMLKTEGRGRYCGVALEVWNPRGGWWGEGDEKFFVDGEKFPSTFGTGSEDYFGYAWCNPGLFQNAFHNQTRNDGNNVGHVNVNRWHIADNVPFQRSFEGDIEKYYPNDRPTLYACTAYWYLEPGGTDPYTSVPVADRTFYVEAATYKVKGAMEGEKLKVLEKTGGDVSHQYLADRAEKVWSADTQLWWTGAKPGDKLTVALPVPEAGTYNLTAQLTKAADYGIVQLYLDDAVLGGPIDLYNDGVVATGELSLGKHDLTAGEHKLTMEIAGANDKAVKSYMAGLDYVKLTPAK